MAQELNAIREQNILNRLISLRPFYKKQGRKDLIESNERAIAGSEKMLKVKQPYIPEGWTKDNFNGIAANLQEQLQKI